jgi:hypothetical protein
MSTNKQTWYFNYTVKCKLKNYFDKEIKIKNCDSLLHAKIKLNEFCKNKYFEFEEIIILKEENVSFEEFCKNIPDPLAAFNKLFRL